MPSIYLSPSTQEGNPYIIGGNEEQYMNLVADAMEPYLRASGITFTRNSPDMTVNQIIRESNAGNYDLHLALHSNAAPERIAGQIRGTDVYYYAGSTRGQRAAQIIANNFKMIYPIPSRVRTVPTTSLGELRYVRAPSVLIEIAYHDNVEDATWIRDNIDPIARNIVLSLTDYFDIPFIEPGSARTGTVVTQVTPLNLRAEPSMTSRILLQIPRGAQVRVYGQTGDWSIVEYNGVTGYARSEFIR